MRLIVAAMFAVMGCRATEPGVRGPDAAPGSRFIRIDSLTVITDINDDTLVLQPGMVLGRAHPGELPDPYRGRYAVLVRSNRWFLDQRHATPIHTYTQPRPEIAARIRRDAPAVLAWAADEFYCETAAAGGVTRDLLSDAAVLNAREDRYMHWLFAYHGVSLAWYTALGAVSSSDLPAQATVPPRPRRAEHCPQYAGGDGWWVAHFAYLPKPKK